MINPFAAGGPNDVLARLFAQRMGEILGQPIVIENIGGAGGMNGADRVAKAAPDGYTFCKARSERRRRTRRCSRSPPTIQRRIHAGCPDDRGAAGIDCAQGSPRQRHEGICRLRQGQQEKIQFGSAGTGSAIHLGCALMNQVTGLDIVHVPYRGANPAMQDLMSGRVDYLCDIISTAKPQIDGGTVKPSPS